MKRILGIYLLLQILLIPNVYAEELPTISVGSFDAYIGEKIVVPITIKNNQGCSYLGIKINYDDSSLDFLDSKIKGLENADLKDIQRDEDVITLYAMAFQDNKTMKDNGVIAELSFQVKENAVTSELRLEVTDYGGEDLVDFDFRQENGIIRIAERKVTNSTEDLTQSLPSSEGVVTWKSSDESVTSINEEGIATFSKEGTSKITGLDSDGNIIIEKEYSVVDETKKAKKETEKEDERKKKKPNGIIYIFGSLGILLILSILLIIIKYCHHSRIKKAN